jgi:hypothetical protein
MHDAYGQGRQGKQAFALTERIETDDLLTDRISILKADGLRRDGIPASVQGRKIFIDQAEPLIESADLVVRKMSNGGEETFRVIDPGFHEAFPAQESVTPSAM